MNRFTDSNHIATQQIMAKSQIMRQQIIKYVFKQKAVALTFFGATAFTMCINLIKVLKR